MGGRGGRKTRREARRHAARACQQVPEILLGGFVQVRPGVFRDLFQGVDSPKRVAVCAYAWVSMAVAGTPARQHRGDAARKRRPIYLEVWNSGRLDGG